MVSRTAVISRKPLPSTHTAQSLALHAVLVKRKQMQPGEALAEKRPEMNGSFTRAYNGANPLKSVREVVERWLVLTPVSDALIVVEPPVKLRPLNKVTEQPAWRAWIGAPTSAAVAIATLRQIVAIVERSFMLVLLWSLS